MTKHAEYEVAQEAFEELLAAQQTAGDHHEAAYTLVKIADVHYLRRAFPQAWACSKRVAQKRLTPGTSSSKVTGAI
jgi:hypothetical protein